MSHAERFVEVPHGRLRMVLDGEPDAPPIVLVHSAVVNLRSWDAMVPFLVNAGYRVVRYDVRGFGESATEDVEFS
ncbi:MAG TPA: alpha/beta fold hydrolase, partial [Candidatus Binatus sp.]|nr:alpha/beta fold hydrolase [Candidatus Binatus sp.]